MAHGGHSGHGYEGISHSSHSGGVFEHGGHGGHSGHPHGSLSHGCHVGLGYHNVLGALEHLGIADVVTLGIFVDFAMGHASHSVHSYNVGHYSDIPALRGHASANGRELYLPGIARDVTTVEVLYWPHRYCNPQNKVRELMAKNKMVRINPKIMFDLSDIDREEEQIMTWSPFDPADPSNNVSNGWYPGASGTTRMWREFYQVQPCSIPLFGKSKWVPWRTFMVVTGSTWFYAETGDYETRVALTVFSVPFTDEKSGDWTYDWKEIKTHRDRAEVLARELYTYLSHHPATDESVQRRAALLPVETESACDESGQTTTVPPATIGVTNAYPQHLIDEDDGPEGK